MTGDYSAEQGTAAIIARAFGDIFQRSSDCLFLLSERDGQFRFIAINATFTTVTGVAASEVVGRLVEDVIPSPANRYVIGRYQQALASNAPVEWTEVSSYPIGRLVGHVTVFPASNHGGTRYLAGIVRDLTPLQREQGRTAQLGDARYRTLVRHAPVVFVIIDGDGRFTLCEGRGLDSTGVSPDAIIGRPAVQVIGTVPLHERTGATTLGRDVIGRVLAGETVTGLAEFGGRMFDNTFLPSRDDAGTVTGIVGVGVDVTESRRAFEQLCRSEEQFRSMIEHSSEVISLHDADGIMRYQSPSITRLLGYHPEELVGQAVLSYIHPDDRADTALRIAEICAEPGRHVTFETRFRHKSGEWRWFECAGTNLLDNAAVDRIVFNARDITERTRAEQELRRSEDRFRSVVERISDVITVLSAEGDVLYTSPSIVPVLGYRPESVVGRSVFDFVHPDDAGAIREEILRRSFSTTAREFRFRHEDGSWRVLEAAGRTMDSGWGLARILVAARDVTRRRQLEEDLRQAQRLESVGQLAGGIAHDFNNMLTVINGYSDLALEQLAADDPLRLDIEEIRKAGNRAATLTYQLLAFSRKQILQPRRLHVNDLIADVGKMLQRLIGEHILMETRLRASEDALVADAGQMTQVLMNLVVNARDAMPAGGSLLIETSNAEIGAGDRRAATMVEGRYVVTTVADTGDGMSAETRAQIFEPFFTTKPVGRGTGMGLATVYGIVTQSRGYITVASELGKGSRFDVYLPVAPADEGVAAHDAAGHAPGGKETVLLVEDEPMVRKLTAQMLAGFGYRVLSAADGPEALELCRTAAEVALLVTDVVMPHMSGPELAAELTRLRPGLRVLMMSGYTDDRGVSAGTPGETVHFLQKPFNAQELSRMVREVLDGPAAG